MICHIVRNVFSLKGADVYLFNKLTNDNRNWNISLIVLFEIPQETCLKVMKYVFFFKYKNKHIA